MLPIHTILHPTDFSDCSDSAFRLACALARDYGSQAQVHKVMTRHVLAIPEDTGIYTATKFMRERGVRRLPVVDREDRLVGMVTLDDLMGRLAHELYNLAEGIKDEVEVK